MPVNFQRLKAGSGFRVSQATADALIASAEHHAKHSRNPHHIAPPSYGFEGNVVQAQNNSNADMPRFSVAGFTTALITPTNNLNEFQNFPRFSLQTPTTSDAGRFCVTVDPIASGAIGLVLVSGLVPVQIYLKNGDSAPSFADVKDGQIGYLQAANSGAQVLYCQAAGSSDGPVWAYVRIPGSGTPNILCFGKTTAAVDTSAPYFTVNNITSADQGKAPTTSSSDTMIVANWCQWGTANAGTPIMFCVSNLNASGDSIGHGQFVQGPCSTQSS